MYGRYGLSDSSLKPALLDKQGLAFTNWVSTFEEDALLIMQHFAPNTSDLPSEFDLSRNQICGSWVEILPRLPLIKGKKRLLSSAVKILATAIRVHSLKGAYCEALLLEMYGNSLRFKLYGPGSAFFTLPTAIKVFESDKDTYRLQLSRCEMVLGQLASIRVTFPRI